MNIYEVGSIWSNHSGSQLRFLGIHYMFLYKSPQREVGSRPFVPDVPGKIPLYLCWNNLSMTSVMFSHRKSVLIIRRQSFGNIGMVSLATSSVTSVIVQNLRTDLMAVRQLGHSALHGLRHFVIFISEMGQLRGSENQGTWCQARWPGFNLWNQCRERIEPTLTNCLFMSTDALRRVCTPPMIKTRYSTFFFKALSWKVESRLCSILATAELTALRDSYLTLCSPFLFQLLARFFFYHLDFSGKFSMGKAIGGEEKGQEAERGDKGQCAYCMYVYMYVWMYVYMYVCMNVSW